VIVVNDANYSLPGLMLQVQNWVAGDTGLEGLLAPERWWFEQKFE